MGQFMHRAEEECHRLQGLLSTMDASMRTLRSQNAEERERLRGEQARLDIMQSTLKAESDVQRMGVKEEKQRLHEQKMQFDEERLGSGRELTLMRQQSDEERRRLDRERIEHTQLQGETVLQMRRLKEEEAQLRQERIDIDRAFLELDKERYKCEEVMAQANDVRKEMDQLDEMKAYMRTVWAQLEAKSEEVKNMLRDALLAKNKCNEQMNESLRLKNQMKQQKMQVQYSTVQYSTVQYSTVQYSGRTGGREGVGRLSTTTCFRFFESNLILLHAISSFHTFSHSTSWKQPHGSTAKRKNACSKRRIWSTGTGLC
jgi:Fas-binding factor 1